MKQQEATSYHNITKDLYNKNITPLDKINLIVRVEQDIFHWSKDVDNLEILIKTMLDLLYDLNDSLNNEGGILKLEKKTPLAIQLVNKVMIFITNLLIFYDKKNSFNDTNKSSENYMSEFLDFSTKQISNCSSINISNKQKFLPLIHFRTIISSCIMQLCSSTNIASRLSKIQEFKQSQKVLTAFLITSKIELIVGRREFEEILKQSLLYESCVSNKILLCLSEELLQTSTDTVIGTTKPVNVSYVKELVSTLAARKDLECIHLMLLLMLTTRYRIFSPQSELSIIQNLCELAFDQSSTTSQRLLALGLVQDLATKTNQPDVLYDEILLPNSSDKVDTLEKKLCIISSFHSISDIEMLKIMRSIVDRFTSSKDKNVRLACSIYRMLSFLINERPGLIYEIETIVFELATKYKLLKHTLNLMQTQPSMINSLATRLMEYLVLNNENVLDIDQDEESELNSKENFRLRHQLGLFHLLTFLDQNQVNEAHLIRFFEIISQQLLEDQSEYPDCLEKFTELLWDCKFGATLKEKFKEVLLQMLNNSLDSSLSIWVHLLYHAMQYSDDSSAMKELKICSPFKNINETDMIVSLEEKSCDSCDTCPFGLKRLDHINYASFPPTDSTMKFLFSINLNESENVQQVFCLMIEIVQEDSEGSIKKVEIPILRKKSSKTFEVTFIPKSPNSMTFKFSYRFTDITSRSFDYKDCDSIKISTKDLMLPVSPEYNNSSSINFDDLWKDLLNDSQSIKTVILIPTIQSIEEFFEQKPWLLMYKLDSKASSTCLTENSYTKDNLLSKDSSQQEDTSLIPSNTQNLLCILPEKLLLLKLSIINRSIKVKVLTDEYRIIDHLYYLLVDDHKEKTGI